MIQDTLPPERARLIYDRIGARYDWLEFYESRAKELALEWLDLAPGLKVLEAGVGTGKQHARLASLVGPTGFSLGFDLSTGMLAASKVAGIANLMQADTCRLPVKSAVFDRLYAAYLLDLIPASRLPLLLEEYRRVLRPGGRLVLVSLTEGVDPVSRAVVGLWKAVYGVSPAVCAGCRPLQLANLVAGAGLRLLDRQVVVQFGIPSEVLVASRA